MDLYMEEPLYATIRRQRSKSCRRSSLEPVLPPPPPPEFNDTDATDVEVAYGGKIIANAAAVIVQRAWRTHRLAKQFRQLMTYAQTNERLAGVVDNCTADHCRQYNSNNNRHMTTFGNSSVQQSVQQVRKVLKIVKGFMYCGGVVSIIHMSIMEPMDHIYNHNSTTLFYPFINTLH